MCDTGMRGQGVAVNFGPACFEKPEEDLSVIYTEIVFTILFNKLSSRIVT